MFSYSKCACGAVTVDMNGISYSCRWRDRKKYFPGLDFRRLRRDPTSYACNHCINHYGLDLCGCGSGERFGHCHNKYHECAVPMQKIGMYDKVRASDSLID